MLADAPPFEDIARELRARLAGRVFVAHNVRFDYGFVRREFARRGDEWSARFVVHRAAVARAVSAAGASQSRRAHRTPWHRDRQSASRHARCAGAVGAVAQAAPGMAGGRIAAGARARRAARRTAGVLPPDLADELPDGARRVPVLRRGPADGRRGAALYWQGQQPARTRAQLFLRRDARCALDAIAAQVRRVEWTETAGELGALLLEAREIRERQPRYNRQLRGAGARFTWLFEERSRPAAGDTGRATCCAPAMHSARIAPSGTRAARSKSWRVRISGASRCSASKRVRAPASATRWAAARAPAWARNRARVTWRA